MITSYNATINLIMGAGSSERIGKAIQDLNCKKALLIYDRGIKSAGIAEKIESSIRAADIGCVCFEDVEPDPKDTIVESAANTARQNKVDCIVAVGGGSSIDTAKAVNVLINNPPPISRYFNLDFPIKNGLPLIFIPTTSGTGSEVTKMCVITDSKKGQKCCIISEEVCAGTLAIIDPELTVGLPANITAATGMDAFSHAVEAMTCINENPMSDALAREAIRMIKRYLPIAVYNASNIEAREMMILASMIAGLAFTNTLVHLGHGFGHSFGAAFHIPHGVACAVCLPQVVAHVAKAVPNKVKMIGECLDLKFPENASDTEISNLTCSEIDKLNKTVGIPRLKDLNLSWENIASLASVIAADDTRLNCPEPPAANEVLNMLQEAYFNA